MSEHDRHDRTEPASPRRRQEFRERGEVAKSRDLAGAVVLLGTLGALAVAGEGVFGSLRAGMRATFTALGQSRPDVPSTTLGEPLVDIALALAPVLGVAAVAALAGHLGQTGLLFSAKALAPSLERLSPLRRLRQMVSLQAAFETGKTMVKLALVGFVVHRIVASEIEALSDLGVASATDIAANVCALALRVAGYGGLTLFALGAFDYAWQRWQLEKRMRMTKQEMKEDHKRQEGDPLIKMRIRARQRELARQRMMQAVRSADVVVTNPTHIAVALVYRPSEMGAPRVVAKGRGPIAERIKALAREHGIPVMENRPLARALYKVVKVGREIPAALYRAVAEVLAYVYGRRGRGPDGRPLGERR